MVTRPQSQLETAPRLWVVDNGESYSAWAVEYVLTRWPPEVVKQAMALAGWTVMVGAESFLTTDDCRTVSLEHFLERNCYSTPLEKCAGVLPDDLLRGVAMEMGPDAYGTYCRREWLLAAIAAGKGGAS